MSSQGGMPFQREEATLYNAGVRLPLAIFLSVKAPSGRRIEEFISTDCVP